MTILFIDKNYYVLNEITINSRLFNGARRLLANHLSIEYVSQYLGHPNREITRKFYVYLLPEQKSFEDVRLLELLG